MLAMVFLFNPILEKLTAYGHRSGNLVIAKRNEYV